MRSPAGWETRPATAPQSSRGCRTGRVGFCFSVFKTEADTLRHENRADVGQPRRWGRGADASGKPPIALETLSLGVPLAQKPHQGSASGQLHQTPSMRSQAMCL